MTVKPISDAGHKDLYRRLIRNLGFLMGGTGSAAIFNMAALAFNVRALTIDEFGLLVLLQASVLLLGGLTSFGTQQPVIQLGSGALAQGERTRLGQIIGLALTFDIAAAVTAVGIAFAAIFVAGDLIGISGAEISYASVFAGSLLFSGYLTSNGIFRLYDRFDLLSYIQAGGAAAVCVASAIFYFVAAPFAAYVWMWAGLMALTVQAQLWTSLYLLNRRGVKINFRYQGMHRSDIKKFYSYCWTTWGTSSTETIRTNGDALLVGWLVSVEAAGIYNVAKQVAGILRKLTVIYASAVFPEVSKLAAADNLPAARRLRSRMIWAGAGLGALVVALTMLLGRQLLGIAFGDVFIAGYWALVLLMLAAGLQLISHTLAVYVQIFVSPARLFVFYFTGFILFCLSAPIGVLAMGMAGAAVAQILFSCAVIALSALATNRALLPR